MNRREILERAADLTEGARQEQYGTWADNAQDIAAVWSVLIGSNVSARQVTLCMAALKLVRLKHGPHEDSYIDLAGYAALGGESDE